MEKITKQRGVIETEKGPLPVELIDCQKEIESLSKKLHLPVELLNNVLNDVLVSGKQGENYPADVFGKQLFSHNKSENTKI